MLSIKSLKEKDYFKLVTTRIIPKCYPLFNDKKVKMFMLINLLPVTNELKLNCVGNTLK